MDNDGTHGNQTSNDGSPQTSAGASLLGAPFREIAVSGGRIRYRRLGSGVPLLFVHGVFVNSDLWRTVVPLLTDRFDCVVLDLPLGSHSLPMDPRAALSPGDLAAILAQIIEALDLGPVRIVANDSGGALAQILTSRRPDLVHSMVLTSCDTYDYFFPPLFRTLPIVARIPGAIAGLAQALRLRWFRALPIAYGWVTVSPIADETMDSYIRPMRQSAAVRADLASVLKDVRPHYTLDAMERLRTYDGSVLLVWGEYDKVFPLSHARRLAADLRNAALVTLPGAGAFVPEDAPVRLAELIGRFFGDPVSGPPRTEG
ncbi:alpha/beta fold hydrolase [Pedococcus sp. 5OH_020]|uniref:alpha/beta fold hydrolase n=1 Tax=Pedococcus sp. 5OH_020 TaxID=2989814 RepID=UPI0022E9DC7D|nr:alpha/beta hydrolase [Pedococcus sp. 5OH_020]